MGKRKGSFGYIFIIILLILMFGGYILYDQGIIKLDMFNKKEEVKEENKEELDVNSRVVQTLYNSVTLDSDNADLYKYWIYADIRSSLSTEVEDFYADEASEEIKMNIVGQNLIEKRKRYVNCSTTTIPDKNDRGFSLCYYEKNASDFGGRGFGQQYLFEREYIETIYKSIFGKDAEFDTSVTIRDSRVAGYSYSYVESEDAYFAYFTEGGHTSGGLDGYTTSLDSAVKDGNKIYIYESVKKETYNSDSVLEKTENFKMIYTFELEDDGMYKFVSRVKEDK